VEKYTGIISGIKQQALLKLTASKLKVPEYNIPALIG